MSLRPIWDPQTSRKLTVSGLRLLSRSIVEKHSLTMAFLDWQISWRKMGLEVLSVIYRLVRSSRAEMGLCRLTSFMFLYKRSLFLSRKPGMEAEQTASQSVSTVLGDCVWHCGFFYPQRSRWPPRHNAGGGNLPSPETSVSFCRPVCVWAMEGDRGTKSERPNPKPSPDEHWD